MSLITIIMNDGTRVLGQRDALSGSLSIRRFSDRAEADREAARVMREYPKIEARVHTREGPMLYVGLDDKT